MHQESKDVVMGDVPMVGTNPDIQGEGTNTDGEVFEPTFGKDKQTRFNIELEVWHSSFIPQSNSPNTTN